MLVRYINQLIEQEEAWILEETIWIYRGDVVGGIGITLFLPIVGIKRGKKYVWYFLKPFYRI